MSNISKIEPARQSLIASMASEYQMEPKAFADAVRATCMPPTATNEEFAAFLMVAKQYGLNPVTREIYAFPKKGGGIQPIVGIDGWMNLINSHPACNGMEFEDHFDDKHKLSAITCRIHRKDRAHPTMVTEYMEECRRPSEPWQKWPARMLRHKAAIQCARYAFGFAGIIDPEEAERSPEVITGAVVAPPPPMAQIEAPAPIAAETPAEVPDADVFDPETFLSDLQIGLDGADSDELVNEVWDEFDVESTLSNEETAMQRAFDMKTARFKALEFTFPGKQ